MQSQTARFISIEGVEGVGKTTVIQAIKAYLLSEGVDAVFTREPGGTAIAEDIRQVLLQCHEEEMAIDTELLLMFACRAQNIARFIRPALAAGQWVFADRFTDASFAYQGGGRKVGQTRVASLAQWVLGDFKPDMTLLLDAPIEVGMQRISKRGAKDRLEQEGNEFFERTRAAYLALAEAEPQRFVVIDATQTPDKVAESAISAIAHFRARVSAI